MQQSDLLSHLIDVFGKNGLWADGVELIGSWAFYMYQKHLGVRATPIKTMDVDFLLPRPYPKRMAVDLHNVLRPLGFSQHFNSDGSNYFLHGDFKVEFLTPERGKGDSKPLNVDPLHLKVVPLRFMDMLKDGPILLKDEGSDVLVPNPKNYALHKLLIAQRRSYQPKREKDIEQAVCTLAVVDRHSFVETFES